MSEELGDTVVRRVGYSYSVEDGHASEADADIKLSLTNTQQTTGSPRDDSVTKGQLGGASLQSKMQAPSIQEDNAAHLVRTACLTMEVKASTLDVRGIHTLSAELPR